MSVVIVICVFMEHYIQRATKHSSLPFALCFQPFMTQNTYRQLSGRYLLLRFVTKYIHYTVTIITDSTCCKIVPILLNPNG